jgi:hypothetical protein
VENDHELQALKDLDSRELLRFPVVTFTRGRYMTAVTQLRQVADIQTFYFQKVNLSFTDILVT